MDLRGIANTAIQSVNRDEEVTVMRSTGYAVVNPGRRQVPTYAETTGPAQIQALANKDLEHVDAVNQQGDLRSVYLRGILAGVVRPQGKGGDLMRRADGSLWLVVAVPETWPTWTHAIIARQMPGEA